MSRSDDAGSRQERLENWVRELAEDGQIRQPPSEIAWRTRLRATGIRATWRLRLLPERVANRILDRGLDTASFVSRPEHEHPDRVSYGPSAWHVLPRALRYLGVSDRDTFVDFGCGKGRVVHQAARRPFRRVVGVEISPALAQSARAGLAARRDQHRCPNVEIVVCDVMDFRVPDDLTVAYLFHPFKNETFEAVIRGILDSIDRNPRRVRLIYTYPVNAPEILATGRFRLIKEQGSRLFDTPVSRVAIFESR
jgi:SAM-dependent methyltransferase